MSIERQPLIYGFVRGESQARHAESEATGRKCESGHGHAERNEIDARLAHWNGPPAILHEADVMHVHGALEAMWQLLADWPNSWYSALARLAELEQREATVISRFPGRYSQRLRLPALSSGG